MCMNATLPARRKAAKPCHDVDDDAVISEQPKVNNSGFKYPVDNFNCNCLVISSLLFFIPAIRAYSCNTSFLGVMALITGIASAQFWWYGIPNWRLAIDKAAAYSTSICYVLTGISHIINDDIEGNYYYIFWYLFFGLVSVTAYLMSCNKWNKGCSTWVIYHMSFHLLLSFGKLLIIEVSSETCSLL